MCLQDPLHDLSWWVSFLIVIICVGCTQRWRRRTTIHIVMCQQSQRRAPLQQATKLHRQSHRRCVWPITHLNEKIRLSLLNIRIFSAVHGHHFHAFILRICFPTHTQHHKNGSTTKTAEQLQQIDGQVHPHREQPIPLQHTEPCPIRGHHHEVAGGQPKVDVPGRPWCKLQDA